MQQCNEADDCRNSVELAGIGGAKCAICRFAPDNVEFKSLSQYFLPLVKGTKHPDAVAEKKQKKLERGKALRVKKNAVDRSKRTLQRQAVRAEKATERNLIHATRNSGRANKDGDHVVANEITLDTKLQTRRENPVVLLDELVKVGQDSVRAGTWMGALMLRNRHGVGVVAMTETDFARLIARLS